MRAIIILLALVGVLAIAGGGYAFVTYKPMYDKYQPMIAKMEGVDVDALIGKMEGLDINAMIAMMDKMKGVDINAMMAMMDQIDIKAMLQMKDSLDPKAPEIYANMMKRLAESKNSAEATVWKIPVQEGISREDVEQAMRFVANEHNIKNVGELPLSEQVQLMTNEDQRYLKIFMFCNPLTAMKMVEYNDAYSAYLPCRIALIEDKEGKLWLYSLDMDMMIWGGETLPDFLHEEAMKVREVILDIMKRGAAGEF